MTEKINLKITKIKTTQQNKEQENENPKKEDKNISIKKNHKKLQELKVGGFKSGDYAFYPSHGVGKIIQIETIEIDQQKLDFLIILFEKEKLTIKVPSNQIIKTGLRPLVSGDKMEEVFNILKSGVKKLKGMWSRRAQEYEAKINSGNIILLAEVLRDLTRDIEDGDRSYSERIIYETAVNRLALEYSIVENIDFEEAKEKIISTAKHKLVLLEGVEVVKKSFDDDFDLEEESEEDEEDDDEDDEDDEKSKKKSKKKK